MAFGSKALLKRVLFSITLCSFLGGSVALANHSHGSRYPNPRPAPAAPRNPVLDDYNNSGSAAATANDSDLVRAVHDRRDVNFVEAANVTVVEILPEDTQGLPHQKWKIQLSDGSKVLAVYNTDMGSHIPLSVGAKMTLGGQFKMTNIGPLIHWLHYDPRHTRPDGYVLLNGVRYGAQH